VASVNSKASPKLIAPNVDLLVEPVWSADSDTIVYRRSTATGYVLALVPAAGGEERVIASSETSALFPVGLSTSGNSVYYVAIDEAAGSRLFETDLASGVSKFVSSLSLGLTRDWSLSPDASKLAYLEIGIGPDEVTSRALVFDFGSEKPEAMTDRTLSAFSPVWSADGSLMVGTLDEATHKAGLLRIDTAARTLIEGPARGFEVPLAVGPVDTGFVVRAFENPSSYSPGRSSLAFVGADGERQSIATGEVTFVGWTNP
jgi:Tol biopolymer transport system component